MSEGKGASTSDGDSRSYEWMDEARREFERRWQAGERPEIAVHAAAAPKSCRRELFAELLLCEVRLRRGIGEEPSIPEYVERHPQFMDEIAKVFRFLQQDAIKPPPSGVDLIPSSLDFGPADAQTVLTETFDLTPDRRPHADDLPEIPGYNVVKVLGRGGMGIVYQAVQLALNRPVALKMIVAGRRATAQQRARFQIEAESLACLQHENIVRIHEVGEHFDGPFLALEFIDGGAMDDLIGQGTCTPTAAAELVRTLANAIHAAHLRGLVHRDLKPANVLMTADGIPKITDFGLAKRFTDEREFTMGNVVMGTPRYMAPEQTTGDNHLIGPPADVYALGVILYELLCGKTPFTANSPYEVLELVRTAPPVPPRRIRRDVPRDLETICLRCMEKAPERRFVSAAALAEDLDRFLTGKPITARTVGRVERVVKWIRRRPAVASLLALLAAVILGAVAGAINYNSRLRAERDRAERHFGLASAALDQVLAEIGDDEFAIAPGMEVRRRELLASALEFSRTLSREKSDDPSMQRKLGFCHRRVGDIQRLLGANSEAEAAYGDAIKVLAELMVNSPDDRDVRLQLAGSHGFLGELRRSTGRSAEAEAAYREALRMYEESAPTAQLDSTWKIEQARTLMNLGILFKETGALERAEVETVAAVRLLERAVEGNPSSRQARRNLARCEVNLGSILRL